MEAAIAKIRQTLRKTFVADYTFTEESTTFQGQINEFWFYICRENYYGCIHLELLYEYEDGTPRISAYFFDSAQPPFIPDEDYTTDELDEFLQLIINRIKAKN